MPININSPLPSSLASECRKAARILNSFRDNGKGVDSIIDPHILADAKGLAIFTVLKAGFLFSGRAGSGLVIARLPDGTWSAPSAIVTGGMGFGGQVGAELTDFIMVLNTTAAVKTFMHTGSITLGGNISVAAGPVGRNAEASGTASIKNVSAVYSYSKTRGLFAGVSFEGSVIVERSDANKKLYGGKVKCSDLLNGNIPPPTGADELYRALEIKTNFQTGGVFGNNYNRSSSSGYSDSNSFNNNDGKRSRSNSNTATGDYNDGSFGSPANRSESFSRAAVRNLAKHGGGLNSSYSSDNRARGNSINKNGYDSPKQITAQPSPSFNSTFQNNKALAITNNSNSNGSSSFDRRARALFNFTGEQDGDLKFHKGDIITIVKKTDTQNDWWTGRLNDREGIFPANFVELL